jgi:conjugative transposon TraK protein
MLGTYAIWVTRSVASSAGEKVYVLVNGKALEAYGEGRRDNIPVEAEDHLKTFHALFFTLHPDEAVIRRNLESALYLADRSAKDQYDNLRENNYYDNVVSGNISQEISADSITVDLEQYPYRFRYRGTQKITRPRSLSTRTLVTEGYLRTVGRSQNNAHGFLIEKWRILENQDIQTVGR